MPPKKPDSQPQLKCLWDYVYWPKAAAAGFTMDNRRNFWLPSGQYMVPGRNYYVDHLNYFFVVRKGILYYSTYCE